jgi:hypothetical protein
MILKNKATYIYKITLLVVLILLVLFLSRNFLFSSFNDSVRPVANAVAVSAIKYEKGAEQSRANNSYVLQERVMELQKIITNRDTNLALPLINLFVSSANASEYGLILIKTGSLNFAVKDLDTAYQSIKTKIQNSNGYITSENSRGSKNTNLVIKVPVSDFHQLLELIEKEADQEYLVTKSVNSQDVTEEYIDVESRIKSKKAIETRYLEILTKARNVTEILKVEKELGKIRTEIEQSEGRLQYLRNRSNYSTISLTIYEFQVSEVKPVQPIEKPSLISKMKNSLIIGWGQVESLLLFLISNWFAILLASGVAYYAKRKYLKHKSRKDT